ncbi:MAG: UDP-glucose/GDP-mannose dehydrogenase family protein [Terriglobia bacterium]|jgi:GDP-mannose 6-dehydrogenase
MMQSKTQSVSIFGLGYVGSVMAACLAHKGNKVIGVDVSAAKVEMLASGRSPIVEARVDELVAEGSKACRLHATTDPAAAVRDSEISFLCVGTPSQRNGKLDLSHVEHVCREIGDAIGHKDSPHLVVLRSTVLPGTTESLAIPTLEAASGKRLGEGFTVCYNPEFMREGSAVADFFQPPYTVLGARDVAHLAPLRRVYEWAPGRVFETSIAVAEMVKYVSNVFHALKVDFANEIGTVAKHLGVDTQAVAEIYTADTRLNISPAYLMPGFAFGGSCLPKDLRALQYRAKELDLRLPLLESLMPSNQEHIERAVESVLRTGKKKVALLGLSFKAGTDDLRESPQVQLAKKLLGEGCQLRIWDPHVSLGQLTGSNRQYIEEVIPHLGSLLSPNLQEVMESAEVIVVGTKSATKDMLAEHLKPEHIVIDLINLDRAARVAGQPQYQGICW